MSLMKVSGEMQGTFETERLVGRPRLKPQLRLTTLPKDL